MRTRRWCTAVFVGVAFSASMVLSGCTSARNALGTNSSPCYLALPVAEDAVHGIGKFGGVRLVTAKQLAGKTQFLQMLTSRAGGTLKDICVVEYHGTYSPSKVEKPLGHPPPSGVGSYAIVVVDRSNNKLLGTFVRSTMPVRFRHLADSRRATVPHVGKMPALDFRIGDG